MAFFHFVMILLIAYLLAKRWGEIRNKLYWSAFVFHILAGVSVGLVYLYYYTANDTWDCFVMASGLADLARQDIFSYAKLLTDFSWDQGPYITTHDFRSVIFIKIISLLSLLGGNNYWVCAGYFSLISFGASWFLFRKINQYFHESTQAAAIAFLFFPSVVFWSSGIIKETLTLASLYFLVGVFLQIFFDRMVDKLVLIISFLASVILWTLKYYWAGVFFITAIASFLALWLSLKSSLAKKNSVVIYVLLFVFIGLAVSFLHPNFYLHRFLEVLVVNHDELIRLSNEHGLIHYYELSATIKSVIINLPWALVSGIFRPFIGEGQGMLGLAASIENLFVLILFISFLWRFKIHSHRPISILVLAGISYCVVLCIFLALSTPNLGTLSRYRVGFLPFLIFMIAYRNPLVDWTVKKFSS
jgi:hypothetical protein